MIYGLYVGENTEKGFSTAATITGLNYSEDDYYDCFNYDTKQTYLYIELPIMRIHNHIINKRLALPLEYMSENRQRSGT